MSQFKVSREKIKLFEHPNADLLQIGKVGIYQVVVQKGLYKDGDVVTFAPEKSVLTGKLREEYEKYLAGADKNRVHSVRLRGQLSCGIIIPDELVPVQSEIGEDISQKLGIVKYIPVIPKELDGDAEPATIDSYVKHDVEQFLVFEENFVPGERVVVTEKVHGVQTSLVLEAKEGITDGFEFNVMSKGLADQFMAFSLTENNMKENFHVKVAFEYGLASNMTLLLKSLRDSTEHIKVQVVGEILPTQTGYRYGQEKHVVRIFDVIVTHGVNEPVHLQYDQVPEFFNKLWVPVIFDGPYDKAAMMKLAKGKEQVSGKGVHIREGVVVRPYTARRASDGTRLVVKIINPDYRETGEELS